MLRIRGVLALAAFAMLITWTADVPVGQAAPAARAGAASARIPVIISTDLSTGLNGGWRAGINDIDDGLAVAMALNDPSLDVRGIVVTFGNNDMEPEAVVANRIVHGLLHSRVPVLRGAAVALSDPQVSWYDGSPLTEGCLNEGVVFMAEELRRGPLTIVGIGPLTDIACLVQNYPVEAANISRVVAIMGRAPDESFAIGQVEGLTDFNFVMDPRAAAVILDESSVPVTFMTFALTSSALVPRAAVAALASGTSPVSRFFADASMPWLDFWQQTFREDGFHPWDQNAVYTVGHPAVCACTAAIAEIVACSGASYHNTPDNPCAGHGPAQKTSLDKESAQLWLSPGSDPRLQICTAYASSAAKQQFLDDIFAFTR